jgi:hypothetical protein
MSMKQELAIHEMLDHAWRYFELHAGQRMSLFNFFLVVSGVILAGLAACLQLTGSLRLLGLCLGVLLAVVAFTFWKLDQRVSFLIKHAEDAIVGIEKLLPLDVARLFSNERGRTAAHKSVGIGLVRPWTYGSAFRFIFWIMGLVGISGGTLSLARYLGWIR